MVAITPGKMKKKAENSKDERVYLPLKTERLEFAFGEEGDISQRTVVLTAKVVKQPSNPSRGNATDL